MTMVLTVAINPFLSISRKRKLTILNSFYCSLLNYVIQHFLFHLFSSTF